MRGIMKGTLAGATFGLLMFWLGTANAGNLKWSIQMHFPITGHSHGHNPAHGTIGSSPNTHSYPSCGHLHHDYHITPPHNSGFYHLDHYHY